MATVVYVPPDQGGAAGIGAALGQGVSTGLMRHLEKKEREEKIKKVQAAFEGIRKAAESGGRKAALEAANVALSLAEDAQDIAAIQRFVEQVAPLKDETPREVDVVGPDGKPTKRFIPQADLPKLNTPEGAAELLGPGFRLPTKEDELVEFFAPDATGRGPTSMGKFPMSQRPAGTFTKEELNFQRQARQDRLAENRDLRAEKQLELAQRREERMQESLTRVLARVSGADKDRVADNYRSDTRLGESLLVRGLGRQLPDGTFGFDDDNKADIFNKRMELFGELLEQEYSKGKAFVNVGKIVNQAIKAFPTSAERALKEPKKKGLKKPDETKTIRGKTYYRYGNDWYTEQLEE